MSDEGHISERAPAALTSRIRELEGQRDQLAQELRQYRSLVERSLQGLLIYNEGGVVFANRAAERITGYSAEELRGIDPDTLLRADALDARGNPPLSSGGAVSRFELQLQRKEGSERRVEVATTLIDHGGKTAVMVTLNDITDRWHAEAQLDSSEARYRTLFQAEADAVFLVDETSGAILDANPAAERLYGYSRDELLALRAWDLSAEPEATRAAIKLHKQPVSETTHVPHRRHLRKDGQEIVVEINAGHFELQGRLVNISTIRDITARLRAEQALKEVAAQRRSEEQAIAVERGRIAREIHDGLAQDLTALGIRLGLCTMMATDECAELREELDALKGLTQGSVREVRRLIFALRPVELERVGFFKALRRLVEGFADHYQICMDLKLDDERALPEAVELVLFRVTQEALHNANRHGASSRVTVQLQVPQPEGHLIVLNVKDNGVGFDLGELEQATEEGHLGLALMRERVVQLGGELAVRSQPDGGTSIEVRLPLA